MGTPGPVVTPPPFPTTPGQVKAWTAYNQQQMEAAKPIVIGGGQQPPPGPPPPIQSQHPRWINICPECNAQVNTPCRSPQGLALAYEHGVRNV